MRYEKKMLILSGDGKGVVMIERSAYGVKFALRTFDVDETDLKVGIVTPSAVFVRDISSGKNPSAVFYIEDIELDALHFAVFGRELVLYGATCKKMWEANLMGILVKHASFGGDTTPAPQKLPPLAPKPDKLPLPDGTGLPQARAAIYGDDALAESDFYTPFDLAPRMPQVDSFLDTPRILDGLAPEITPRMANPSVPPAAAEAEAAASVDVSEKVSASSARGPEPTEMPIATDTEIKESGSSADAEAIEESSVTADAENNDRVAEKSGARDPDGQSFEAKKGKREETSTAAADEEKEAAERAEVDAARDGGGAEMPWFLEKKYLTGLSTREAVQVRARAAVKIGQKSEIPKLRDATFFERSRQDVEKLFETAAADGELNALLPDLKWVKVKFDGHTVSVGRDRSVLCYAVAGLYEKVSPFGDKAQWLPKLKNAPTGKGYWLIFQDLDSGRIVGAV